MAQINVPEDYKTLDVNTLGNLLISSIKSMA